MAAPPQTQPYVCDVCTDRCPHGGLGARICVLCGLMYVCMYVRLCFLGTNRASPGRPRGSSAIGCVAALFGFLGVAFFFFVVLPFVLRSRPLVHTVDRRPSAAAWKEVPRCVGVCASFLPCSIIIIIIAGSCPPPPPPGLAWHSARLGGWLAGWARPLPSSAVLGRLGHTPHPSLLTRRLSGSVFSTTRSKN